MLKENEIYLGDCLDIMRDIPDKSVDLILTDIPYGINADKKNSIDKKQSIKSACNSNFYGNQKWDNDIPDKIYFDEIFRISKNQIIFGGNYVGLKGGYIYWKKNVSMPTYSDGELAWYSHGIKIKEYEYTWHGMIQEDMKNKQIRKHPTEKPIALLQMILKDFSKENDLIFDGFAGSGTTALACIELNRRFICVEKDVDYYNIARKRIEDAKSQLRLFN